MILAQAVPPTVILSILIVGMGAALGQEGGHPLGLATDLRLGGAPLQQG
jgi:hypothetical protein